MKPFFFKVYNFHLLLHLHLPLISSSLGLCPLCGGRRALLLPGPVLQEPAVAGHQRDQAEDEHLHLKHQGVGGHHAARGGLSEGLPAPP